MISSETFSGMLLSDAASTYTTLTYFSNSASLRRMSSSDASYRIERSKSKSAAGIPWRYSNSICLKTYVDDEYAERAIRCSRTYYEYAKDICENYRMDLRRYKLIRERKQYIGISNREAYQAMCEDLAFAQQSLKTVLNDYADLFRKRFSEGLSIRKAADAMQQNRGVIERRQAALYRAFAQLLQQRDEADGVCRLMQKTEYDQRDIEDLLE